MKKITIALVLISLAGMSLFAEGSKEESSWESDIEELTITGKIDLSDVNAPKLAVGEDLYELMIPYRLDYNIDIKDGDEITIEGFEVPAYRRSTDPETLNLMVTGATFNGEEYDLAPMDYGHMGYGPKGSPMNGGFPGRSGRSNKNGFWGPQSGGRGNMPYNYPWCN